MSSGRFPSLRRMLSRSTSTRDTSTTRTTPPPPPRRGPSLFRRMRSVMPSFGSRRNVTPPGPLPLVYGPPPRTSTAFQNLEHDPQTFMRRNAVKIQGKYGKTSGKTDFVMYNAGPIGKRRNSVSGDLQDVFEYRISSQEDFKRFANRPDKGGVDSFDTHTFMAQHIAMEPVHKSFYDTPDQDPGSSALVRHGRSQNYITNSVTGCSIVRKNNDLGHWWPFNQVERNYSSGEELEQGIRQDQPESQVFGPSNYDKSGTNLFIQSTRRGSVHIHGQSGETGRGTDHWSANVQDHRFAPSPPRPRRPRMTSEFYRKNVEKARRGIQFEHDLNSSIRKAQRFVPEDPINPHDPGPQDWD